MNPFDKLAAPGIARDEGELARLERLIRVLLLIEAQAGFAGFLVWAVTGVAFVRKEGPDLAIEVDGSMAVPRRLAGSGTEAAAVTLALGTPRTRAVIARPANLWSGARSFN